MKTPYVGFSNDTLDQQPILRDGNQIKCPHCNNHHEVECGTVDGKKSDLLMFFKCGDLVYLAGVDGRSVLGQKSDCSGTL
jgi:hypothetical protein